MATRAELPCMPATRRQRLYLYGLTKDKHYLEQEFSMEYAGREIARLRKSKERRIEWTLK